MKNLINKFAADESGATAIEYGLIAALIATALIAAFATFNPTSWFTGLNSAVSSRVPT